VRISELSRATGVPVATIKYYLREELLHDGKLTSATQAQYDDTHVARLRLIRALISVGDLSVATTKRVLAQLDQPRASLHELLGQVHQLLESRQEDMDTAKADEVIERMHWRVPRSEPVRRLAVALDALEAADFPLETDTVITYAKAMQDLARQEVDSVPVESDAAAVRHVLLGTILIEPLLLALRRLAQIDASARRLGMDPPPP
jgi:DNA-binding transcriptional MerR regulator